MASGANHSRLKSMTYPNGRILRYEYSAGLDDAISRVSFLADDLAGAVSTQLEAYSYLGLSTIVERNHPESGINLTYVGGGTADAGDKYVGLDRFNRVVDHRWVDVAGPGATDDRDAERFRYAYDRNSNRTSREWDSNQMPSTFKGDEAYFYDNLNRLTKANRGTLAGGTITDGNAAYAQQWDNTGATGSGYDALGNWKGVTTDSNGGTSGGATTETRTHNSQNQVATVSGATTSPAYDDAGSMTRDETGQQYTYDAWGRTVKVKNTAGTDKVTYTLDALGRRVAQDVTSSGVGGDTQYYHSANWQVLEERENLGGSYTPRWQNVFSLAYIDAVVARDTLDATTAGELDNSFSGDGKYVHSIPGTSDFLRFITQSDNKIVGVGDAGGDLVVARFNADGSLDSSFDGPAGTGNGLFTIHIGSVDQAMGVAVQSDGKLVISGYVDADLLLMRLNLDGSYDTTFDGPSGTGDGKFTINISGTDNGRDVEIQSDGKIVVGGLSGENFFVGRFNTNGTWDASYNTVGYQTVDFGGTDRGFELSLDRDGRAVVVGETTTGGTGGDIAIIRLTTAGALDTSFDGDGKKTISLTTGQDSSRALNIDSQNRMVIGAAGGGDFNVIRLNVDGSFDTTFDGDGKTAVEVSGADVANELVIDSRGRILVAGSSGGGVDFAVIRLKGSDGALDTSFSGDGKQTVSFSGTSTHSEYANGMLVDGYGRIVVAGASNGDIAIARLSGGGSRHYLIQDANYNVTATADGAGRVIDRYQYTVYGVWTTLNADFSADLDAAGEVYQAYYFQGLRFDGNSYNHHMRGRDYRASLGRPTQNDPARYVDGANLYEFVSSAPVSYVDPIGLGKNDVSWWYTFKAAVGLGEEGSAGAAKVRGGVAEGAKAGASIAASEFSGGLSDRAGLTESSQYRGHPQLGSGEGLAQFGSFLLPMGKPGKAIGFASDLVAAYDVATDPCAEASDLLQFVPIPGNKNKKRVDVAPPKPTKQKSIPLKLADPNQRIPDPTAPICFVAGTDVLEGDGDTIDIENIRVGDRMATDGGVSNSGSLAIDTSATEVDRKTWRKVTIKAVHKWEDGTKDVWDIETLQPVDWLRSRRAKIDLDEVLDLAEMGVPDGLRGRIVDIKRCPRLEGGPGRVVLTTVNHLNNFVFDLTLTNAAGELETLGVTGWHKFYDQAEGWQSASELTIGDTLRGLAGEDVTVVALAQRPTTERVYNMTVEADHVYFVGDLTTLTHNVKCLPTDRDARHGSDSHHDRMLQEARSPTLPDGVTPVQTRTNQALMNPENPDGPPLGLKQAYRSSF